MDDTVGSDAGKEKGGKNKRKLDDPFVENPDLPLSPTYVPECDLCREKNENACSDCGSFQAEMNLGRLVEEFDHADWDDPIAYELEELLSSNLLTIFKNAIKKIVECGYKEDVAEKAITRHGLYLGGKDLVSNIVDRTLDMLKEGEGSDTSSDHSFENLKHQVEYTMLEMISVLREVKPSLSITEAMWLLLMCDLNILVACTAEEDILHGFGCKEVSAEGSSDSTPQCKSETQKFEPFPSNLNEPNNSKHSLAETLSLMPDFYKYTCPLRLYDPQNPKSLEQLILEKVNDESSLASGALKGNIRVTSQVSVLEEKSVYDRKGRKKKQIPALQAKSVSFNRHCYNGKGSYKKLATFSGFFVEKKLKNPSEYPSMHVKNASLKRNAEAGTSADVNHQVAANISGTDNSSASSAKSTLSTSSKADSKLAGSSSSDKKSVPISSAKFTISAASKADSKLAGSSSLEKKSASRSSAEFTISASSKADCKIAGPASLEKESAPRSEGSASKTPSKPDQDAQKNPASKLEDSIFQTTKEIYNYAGIRFDESLGKYVPRDDKDKLILKLVPRLPELLRELQTWTEWANQKVMQAARRLSMEQVELKSLRQDKEEVNRLKKEKQSVEENTSKRLSEMELALNSANNQVERANSNICKLELEHSLLKKDVEAARLRAAESAARCQEAVEREQKALKDAQSCEGKKSLIQQELETLRKGSIEMQKGLEKAKSLYNQAQARCKQVRAENEKILERTASIRKEKERMEAAAKAEENEIKLVAETEKQKYGEETTRVQNEISELRIKLDSSRISSIRRSTNSGKGNHIPSSFKRSIASPSISQSEDLKREHECVMCFSDEKFVVFLPCAHQVLCASCNKRHKEELKECPTCRTTIQRRIHPRFRQL